MADEKTERERDRLYAIAIKSALETQLDAPWDDKVKMITTLLTGMRREREIENRK